MAGAIFELKVVQGEDFLQSPLAQTEIEIYTEGVTARRSRSLRKLHQWAIEQGFVFRRDDRMLFRGYYRNARDDQYAAIL